MNNIITLSHGSGGAKSHELIENVFMPILGEIMDFGGEDGGVFSLVSNDFLESSKNSMETKEAKKLDSKNSIKSNKPMDFKTKDSKKIIESSEFINKNSNDFIESSNILDKDSIESKNKNNKKLGNIESKNSSNSKEITESNNADSINKKNNCLKGVVSTDSYIVYPLFFKGGDIGKLCVCGSSNDVAMMGGKPRFLNIGFIIEEGFDINTLKKIVESIRKECDKLDLRILSADTKVLPTFSTNVPKDSIESNKDSTQNKNLFINTTCIGTLQKEGLSAKNLSHNDVIIISGNIGSHGARIFLEQNNMQIDSDISSDCAALYPMLKPLFARDLGLHALRDATRGGLSAVLNEWAITSGACIEIDENSVGVDNEVQGMCEMLGLESFELANEGVCVLALKEKSAKKVLEILKSHPLGKNAAIIGRVRKDFVDSIESNLQDSMKKDSIKSSKTRDTKEKPLDRIYFQKVVLFTKYGSKRFLEYPQGELLPRIC
ncbi:hydrogenase expression/formation protein HypE [Helicobacter saguini]|nr:hydrogenase expression/formation protein HypE [Helicobacter saguini]